MESMIETNQKPVFVKKITSKRFGLGAEFNSVLAFLHLYELGTYAGIEIDFQKTGNCYDPNYGDNSWEYYFEPLKVGSMEGAKLVEIEWDVNIGLPFYCETREENYRIIQKYIKVKQPILDKVEKFVSERFGSSFVLGLFHRGTDKWQEATTLSYEEIGEKVEKAVAESKGEKIFVSSDEKRFIEYMLDRFPSTIYFEEKMVSDTENPIHVNAPNGYQIGRDSLIDALIFSKTNLLLRMDSCLGAMATFFSPNTPEILLNRPRYTWVSPAEREYYYALKKRAKEGVPALELLEELDI